MAEGSGQAELLAKASSSRLPIFGTRKLRRRQGVIASLDFARFARG